MRLATNTCKMALMFAWFSAAAILFIILFIQSIGGAYNPYTKEAWEWLLPNLMPTLSLMAGVIALEARSNPDPGRPINVSLFIWTLGVSVFYLLVMIATVLALPRVSQDLVKRMEFLKMSSLWLGPFQGLATAFLGIFFLNRPQAERRETSSRQASQAQATQLPSSETT